MSFVSRESGSTRMFLSCNKRANLKYPVQDRKSTRLNSRHGYISYAAFCLKKKNHDVRGILLRVAAEAIRPDLDVVDRVGSAQVDFAPATDARSSGSTIVQPLMLPLRPGIA